MGTSVFLTMCGDRFNIAAPVHKERSLRRIPEPPKALQLEHPGQILRARGVTPQAEFLSILVQMFSSHKVNVLYEGTIKYH